MGSTFDMGVFERVAVRAARWVAPVDRWNGRSYAADLNRLADPA